MKQRIIIDTHKFLTPFVVLALMAFYQRWANTTLWVYLALHGTYAILWLIKSQVYPDKRWEQTLPVPNSIGMFISLGLYWAAPWLIASGNIEVPAWYMALCISLFTFGVFLHYVTDMQKHVELQLNKGHLLHTGLWGFVRNPNYLGELLIYLGFGLLAMHWLPIAVLVVMIGLIWVPNMRQKDRSLARYPEFADYQQHTKRLLPSIY